MNIYVLRPKGWVGERWQEWGGKWGAWSPWYDKVFGFVIQARSLEEARQLASQGHGDEGGAVWLNPEETTCKVLEPSERPGIIMEDLARA